MSTKLIENGTTYANVVLSKVKQKAGRQILDEHTTSSQQTRVQPTADAINNITSAL